MSAPSALDKRVFDCWMHGIGIRHTVRAAARFGMAVSFADVRRRFVGYSEQFCGRGAA